MRWLVTAICWQFAFSFSARAAAAQNLDFEIELETVLEHDDGEFLWFHPRVTTVSPQHGSTGKRVVMTLQKHLHISDYFSGLFTMESHDTGATWTGPDEISELAWKIDADSIDIAVADVTPGWHEPTGRALAVGAQVRYSSAGKQLEDQPRSHQTAYAVFDPVANRWSNWRQIDMPPDREFDFARSACAQWMVEPDGTVLLPFYISTSTKEPFSVTVARFAFDGDELTYLEHGDVLRLPVARGLYEPSLTRFGDRYYLTMRNDEAGYVTSGTGGIHFDPPKQWTFDDGSELGSYNTQQHWVTHSEGLFLTYTRRGANNDHIIRHRAPLFIAQVDPERLVVLRETERVLVPERGATLGNFGAARINEWESWVTVGEGVWSEAAREWGARGALFLARIKWSRPDSPP